MTEQNPQTVPTLEGIRRFIDRGPGKRRFLADGEGLSVPGYEFLPLHITGTSLEVLEFSNGDVCPIIPNVKGLMRAVFSLVVLNRRIAFDRKHLAYVRAHLCFPVAKMADAIGVTRSDLVHYEAGEKPFDKAVELAVRLVAFPRAFSYLPEDLQEEIKKKTGDLDGFYSELDTIKIPASLLREALGEETRKSKARTPEMKVCVCS